MSKRNMNNPKHNAKLAKQNPRQQQPEARDIFAAAFGTPTVAEQEAADSTYAEAEAEARAILAEIDAATEAAAEAHTEDAAELSLSADTSLASITRPALDANDTSSTARGIGSIGISIGGKVVRVTHAVPKMDEARDLRQQMFDEGRLVERPNFVQELADIISPATAKSAPRSNAEYTADVARLHAVPGTRSSYPHIANAQEDVASTLMRLCRNPEDAELLAAVASILPDYMRHQQKEKHISRVEDAQAERIELYVQEQLSAALKRLEFRSGLLAAGGDAELARDLAAWSKRGNNLSIKSNLSAAPHLIPLLKFNDGKTLEQALCHVAQYIPENGHRYSAVVVCPDSSHKPALAYNDPNEAPAGFGKGEFTFNFERVGSSTVHVTLRERVQKASTWSQMADLNPFVLVGAWDVYGSEHSDGEIAVDTVKVQKQQPLDISFLRGEAEKAGAMFVFPDLWNGMRQKAEAL